MDLVVGRDNIFREEAEVWASTFNAVKKAYAKIGVISDVNIAQTEESLPSQRSDWSYMI